MENQASQTYEIMEVCLLAGKIMLQSGGETYRVEDTMMRIAAAFGIENSHSYVTPTGIIFSAEGSEPTKTKLIRISERSTDLKKVAMVNSISRRISSGEVSPKEALKLLKELNSLTLTFPFMVQVAAASLASGCFMIMFNGGWNDFIPAMIAGGLGYLSNIYFHRFVPIRFFSEFLASFVIGLLSFIFVKIGIGQELDKIIIGSVMTLVPGLLITNAIRDLMAGHLVSGLSKGAEAFLTAFAIGSGIAIVLSFL
ncbi:threonine/serine exporter family protein [Neobacillus cucumis]|uniref:threonine/serine exporter family protein n=1 Tax=Neobacillus cucumis TaxID=1740721 RepID=UPI0018DF1206|nr:threonine/serine exporter family protein [Neobacillus cucumis]MBI0578853.1 threonine/serine exporter family protein [Neobacillus cucumis]WHY92648.1 threonine/serine exporter family protein [Neobacillus cucumis]